MSAEKNKKRKGIFSRIGGIVGGGCVGLIIGALGVIFAGLSFIQDRSYNSDELISQQTQIALFVKNNKAQEEQNDLLKTQLSTVTKVMMNAPR